MKCFIDTSAFFALLDSDDVNHPEANATLVKLLEDEANLITSNYVLVESFALIQRRIGFDAVRAFQTSMLPIVHVEFTTPESTAWVLPHRFPPQGAILALLIV